VERYQAIQSLTEQQALEFLHTWREWARAEQIAPDGNWQTWLVLAGRGFGKTRTGAEWVREKVKAGYKRIALIAPTASDARDVMIEGESGILSVCWAGDRTDDGEPLGSPIYEPSKRRVTWYNGAVATAFSAEEPERLRGPQHEAMWCDELAAWQYAQETWDMAMFGLRLGEDPQVCITTTPKPLKILRQIIGDEGTIVTRGKTFDNRANLAPAFLTKIISKYQGTRLGRQELDAELIDDVPGALWTRGIIEENRIPEPKAEAERQALIASMKRIVVAMDPAATSTEGADEMGIVVAGLRQDDHGVILADLSDRLSPDQAARRAIQAYDDWQADRIVGEVNNGGEWIGQTISLTAKAMKLEGARSSGEVAYRAVHASRGKQARAEPIAALDEQHKVHHAGTFPALEDQLCEWQPLAGTASPDRLDARVWALTELMVDLIPGQGMFDFMKEQAEHAAKAREPAALPTPDNGGLRLYAPPGTNTIYLADGRKISPGEDGSIVINPSDAASLRQAGFTNHPQQ